MRLGVEFLLTIHLSVPFSSLPQLTLGAILTLNDESIKQHIFATINAFSAVSMMNFYIHCVKVPKTVTTRMIGPPHSQLKFTASIGLRYFDYKIMVE